MDKKIDKGAFTFVELIVVVTIISILGTIGVMSFTSNIISARDSLRISNISEIEAAMISQKQTKGSFPIPSDYFSIENGAGNIVAWQGKLDKNIGLSTIDDIPYEPKKEIPYLYSITKNKQEFEIVLTLENPDGDKSLSLLSGNYKSVAKNVLPTILIATGNIIDISTNKNLFIFNNQSNNLAYDFIGNNEPVSDGTVFSILLGNAENNGDFSQNSNFETCDEIKDAGKFIGDGEYQIRSSTGSLTNTGCTI